MWKKRLILLAAALMLAACKSGTLPPLQMAPVCDFDPTLLSLSEENLPVAQAGAMPVLMQNRQDSKAQYRDLYLKHRDLSAEVTNCMAAQAPKAGDKSPLDERVEKMKARIQ